MTITIIPCDSSHHSNCYSSPGHVILPLTSNRLDLEFTFTNISSPGSRIHFHQHHTIDLEFTFASITPEICSYQCLHISVFAQIWDAHSSASSISRTQLILAQTQGLLLLAFTHLHMGFSSLTNVLHQTQNFHQRLAIDSHYSSQHQNHKRDVSSTYHF